MKEIYFDLRCGDVKVLVVEEKKIIFKAFYKDIHIEDNKKLVSIIKDIEKNIKVIPKEANLILPDEDFVLQEIALPKISEEEAKNILKARFARVFSSKKEEVNIFIVSTKNEENKNIYGVQTLSPNIVEKYVKIFGMLKIKIKAIISALIASLKFFNNFITPAYAPQAVVDIDKNSINILVISNNEVIDHQFYSLPKLEITKELETGIPIDRIIKRRIYNITDTVYNFKVAFEQHYSAGTLNKFFFSGSGLKLYPSVDEAICEAIGNKIEYLRDFLDGDEENDVYVALYGFIFLMMEEKPFNFLYKKTWETTFFRLFKSKTIISTFAFATLILFFALEYFYYINKKQLKDLERVKERIVDIKKITEEKDNKQKVIANLINQPNFYEVFRLFANNLPQNVYLEKINYFKSADGKEKLECVIVCIVTDSLGDKKILSDAIKILDEVRWIKRKEEPQISNRKEGNTNFMVLKINYEIENYGE